MSALKFLGFTKENGDVTPLLQDFVANEKNRTAVIKQILERCYPEAVRLGTLNATTSQLAETFKPLTSDTLRKAMTFYLHAAKYAGVPVSKNFKVQTGFTKRRPRRTNTDNGMESGSGTGDTAATALQDARTKYVEFLMKRAEATEDPEASERLYDRIERILLGGATDGAE